MVICDTNIISKLLFRDPEVMKQINIIGLKNVYITPIVYIEIVHWLSAFRKFTREERKEIKAFMYSISIKVFLNFLLVLSKRIIVLNSPIFLSVQQEYITTCLYTPTTLNTLNLLKVSPYTKNNEI